MRMILTVAAFLIAIVNVAAAAEQETKFTEARLLELEENLINLCETERDGTVMNEATRRHIERLESQSGVYDEFGRGKLFEQARVLEAFRAMISAGYKGYRDGGGTKALEEIRETARRRPLGKEAKEILSLTGG